MSYFSYFSTLLGEVLKRPSIFQSGLIKIRSHGCPPFIITRSPLKVATPRFYSLFCRRPTVETQACGLGSSPGSDVLVAATNITSRGNMPLVLAYLGSLEGQVANYRKVMDSIYVTFIS